MTTTTNDLTRTQVVRLLAEHREFVMTLHDCALTESMLDIMIAHGVADHAEIDRLEAVIAKLEREIAALHADIRDGGPSWWETALALALTGRDRVGARWGRLRDARQPLSSSDHVAIFVLFAACLGVYVRFGV